MLSESDMEKLSNAYPKGRPEQLRDAFWKLIKSKIRQSPCHTTRASSLGAECERQLFYERTAWEMRAPPSPELQAIFELGKEVEPHVIRTLEAMGVEVIQRGKDYHDRRYDLTGHIDAKIFLPGWEKPIPAEIKGLNPFTAGSIRTVEDIKSHKSAWVRKYYAQLQTYLLLDNSPVGMFVIFDKTAGTLEFIECPLDYEFAEGLLRKAERVRDAVAKNEAPPRRQSEACASCPFVHVCNPDIEFGKEMDLFDDPEIEAMLKRRDELAAAAKEYDALDKAVKSKLPRKPALLVGDWAMTGKEVSRAAYAVKESNYWKWDIRRLTKESK